MLLQFQSEGHNRLHADLPGVDQPHRQILDRPVCQDDIPVRYPFHIDPFLKGKHRLHTGAHSLRIRQIQDRYHQPASQIHHIFSGTDLLHDDLALAVKQVTGIRLVI